MGHVERVQLGQISDWLQLVNLIVRYPQLLQGFRCSLNSLNRVSFFLKTIILINVKMFPAHAQCVCLFCFIIYLKAFDEVPPQREDLEILEDLKVLYLGDQVGGQGQLLTVDEDVQRTLNIPTSRFLNSPPRGAAVGSHVLHVTRLQRRHPCAVVL